MSGSDKFQPTTLIDILRHRAVHQANQIAYTFLIDGEHQEVSLTYQALDQQAKSIAVHLQACCAPGDRALLLYPPGLAYITAFFGCLYAGIVAVPVYPPKPNRSLSRIQTILADAQPKIALTTQSLCTKLKSKFAEASEFKGLHWLATDSSIAGDQFTLATQNWRETGNTDADTLAFLQYTSGSTAAPKGVMVTHRNLLHNLAAIQHLFGHDVHSKGVIWLPPYHDMGLIGGILQPLYSGFSVVLLSPLMFLQRPIRWLKAISRYQATTSGAPNFAYELCVRKLPAQTIEDLDLSSWQVAFNGAETIHHQTLERFTAAFARYGFRGDAFYPCYGMAEATLMISGSRKLSGPMALTICKSALAHNQIVPIAGDRLLLDSSNTLTLVGCGQPLPDQHLRIVDPQTSLLCPALEVGEIWVAGASVASGYWHQPEATQQTFRASLAGTETQSFLRTGDLGFLYNGELFVTGRLKDLMIIRGKNHYPQDIELTVQSVHPALSQGRGAAFLVEFDGAEQLIIAQEVEPRKLGQIEAESVCQLISQAISEQHDLHVFEIVLLKPGSIPTTSSGKLQRYLCRSQFLEKALDVIVNWRAVHPQPDLLTAQTATAIEASAAPSEATHSPKNLTAEDIQAWLTTNLALYLKVEPEAIDIALPFAHYGLDSSVAVSLTGELADWLGIKQLEPTLFWEYPSIEALSHYLATEMSNKTIENQ
jgi:acyl-CoA synthetase (AMP-forming)/AMP-acid ligase II/acyl carrier protein